MGEVTGNQAKLSEPSGKTRNPNGNCGKRGRPILQDIAEFQDIGFYQDKLLLYGYFQAGP